MHVTIREAFSGFNLVVPRHNRGVLHNHSCHIGPGCPGSYRGKYKASDGSTVNVTTHIDGGKFALRGFNDQNNIFSAGLYPGDVELSLEVDALDLINGAWVDTEDLLGEQLRVRIPQGFNPIHRLKVAGKGYYGWLQEYGRPSNARMDMFIKLVPVFKKPSEIDRQKVTDMYAAIQDLETPDAT